MQTIGKWLMMVGWSSILMLHAWAYETRTIQAEMMQPLSGSAWVFPDRPRDGHAFLRVDLFSSSPSARVSIPIRPLPPGEYKLFIAGGLRADFNCTITLANSEVAVPPFSITFNPSSGGTWAGEVYQPDVTLTTRYAYDTIRIEFQRTSSDVIVGVDWLMITNDPSILIYTNPCNPSQKWLTRDTPPSPPRTIPVGTANAFPNSSFEAGDVYWMGAYQWDHQLFNAMIDDTHAYHGMRSLKVEMFASRYSAQPDFGSGRFGSPVLAGFSVQPGRTYTYSFWVYHERSAPVRVSADVYCWDAAPSDPCSNPSREWHQGYYIAGFGWQQVQISFTVPTEYNQPIATVGFGLSATDGTAYDVFPVWLDAFQIHEGDTPSPYQPAKPVEAGVRFALPANMAFSGQENSQIRLYVHKASPANAYFEYKVYDMFDRLVSSGRVDLSSLAIGSHNLPISLNRGRTGWFELYYRTVIIGEPEPPFERTHFSVVPSPTGQSLIGGYGSTGVLPLQIYSLSNINWQNLLSASNFICYWNMVEGAGNDIWALYPHRIRWAQDQGIQLVFPFAIGSAATSSVPGWARRGICDPTCHGSEPYDPNIHIRHRVGGTSYDEYFRLEDWLDYVRTMVRTYKFHIKYWQVIDEPMAGFTVEEYLKLLRATYQAVKQEDPTAIVLVSPHGRFREMLAAEPNLHLYCDGVYEYMRDRNYAYLIRLWALIYRKRVLAVEYIFQRSGWYDLLISTEDPTGDIGQFKGYTWRSVQDVALSALQSLAWSGAERYFLYDMRFPGDLRFNTCFEPDGTWKPAGTLVACMNSILSGYVGMDELGTGSTLRAFWFRSRSGANSLFAVISTTNELRWISMPISSFTALDAFGNPALRQGNNLLIGGLPTYIIVPRAYEAQVKRALIQSSIQKPLRAFYVVGTDLRLGNDGILRLVTRVANNTPFPFRGSAYVFPHWERRSLYHLFGYTPVYTREWYANYAIQRRLSIPAGSYADIAFPLEPAYIPKRVDLTVFYPLYFWLVPDPNDSSQVLPSSEVYTALFPFWP